MVHTSEPERAGLGGAVQIVEAPGHERRPRHQPEQQGVGELWDRLEVKGRPAARGSDGCLQLPCARTPDARDSGDGGQSEGGLSGGSTLGGGRGGGGRRCA